MDHLVYLDRNEYKFHKKKLNYGEDIDRIVKYELSNLTIFFKKMLTLI